MTEKGTYSSEVVIGASAPCFVCGRMTTYHEMNYECPICSPKCMKEMDDNAKEACEHGIKTT